jgi:hypothetical protein
MNCERCQELIGDLVDGSLNSSDESTLNAHLDECLSCVSVRQDLTAILDYCRDHRGVYDPPPNERALWLRIRNVIEAEGATSNSAAMSEPAPRKRWFSRSWELSFPQLAAFVTAVVLFVSLVTTVLMRNPSGAVDVPRTLASDTNINDVIWQRQQVINYWNQRIETNKARWSAQMRETFERNMGVIDQAVTQSMNDLNRNPHDEISEQMLNEALNDKLQLLKEFSDL